MKKINRNTRLRPKLKPDASIKVIGLGGVGSIVARYGAVFLASLGQNARLVLVDGDKFEPSNASRMLFGACGNKAMVIRRELLSRFRHSKLQLASIDQYVKPENIRRLIHSGDIVLLCVDNHKTRKLINDHCATLKNVCLISGGNDGIGKNSAGTYRRGTYGNVQLYLRQSGRDRTFQLDHFHPEIKEPKDKAPHELNCTELVTSVPQVLFANLAVASSMLNTLLLYLSGYWHYSELSFDIADGLMRPTIKPL